MDVVLDLHRTCKGTSPASYVYSSVFQFFYVVFFIALLQKLCAERGSIPNYSFPGDEDSGTVVCKVSCKQHCYL